tara:strand:+ start:1724 stop:1948 length:225 start_codon:yes stop_codon:yes gene_type:complete
MKSGMGNMVKASDLLPSDVDEDMTDEQRQKRRKFTRTLRHIMREQRQLTNYEMAAMFDDDGDLGSAMRHMLLNG